jgi:hypothetical protein
MLLIAASVLAFGMDAWAGGPTDQVRSYTDQKGDRWLIYDILIENLSVISNYRSQFDQVIRTSSYGELVKRLQARVVALNEKDAKVPRGAAQTPR